jgi:hypothetical protein
VGEGSNPTVPHRVDTGTDYLHVAPGVFSSAPAVLTTPAQTDAFPDRIAKSGGREVAEELRAHLHPGTAYPPRGRALVAVVATTGCAQPTGGELWAEGRKLTVHWQGASSAPKECLAPNRALVVFRVPASALPDRPIIEGQQPAPDDPAR